MSAITPPTDANGPKILPDFFISFIIILNLNYY